MWNKNIFRKHSSSEPSRTDWTSRRPSCIEVCPAPRCGSSRRVCRLCCQTRSGPISSCSRSKPFDIVIVVVVSSSCLLKFQVFELSIQRVMTYHFNPSWEYDLLFSFVLDYKVQQRNQHIFILSYEKFKKIWRIHKIKYKTRTISTICCTDIPRSTFKLWVSFVTGLSSGL